MKLTKSKLKQIIREELNEVMNLDFGSPEDLPTGAFGAEDPDVITFNDEEDVIEYIEGLEFAFTRIGMPMTDVAAALRSFPGSLVEFMNGVMTSVQSTYGGPTLAKGTHENEVAKKVAAELGLKSAQTEPKVGAGGTLKSLYKDYVSDHKKEKAAGLIDRYSSEWNRTAANFLDYLEGTEHLDHAEAGFREEGVAFFNKLGIPLKR